MEKSHVIGTSVPRTDALEKVTGAAKYVDDFKFGPALLHARLVRSPHPHAKILSIDTSEAEKLPGVRAVVTGKEFPNFIGLYLLDRTIYAIDKVRYFGEPVAGVAAETEEIAEKACSMVKVEYEPLPGIFDPEDAMKPDAPILHEKLGEYQVAPFIFPEPGTNISNHFKVRKGNVEEAFKQCKVIIEDEYYVPHIQHTPLEPHCCVAKKDGAGSFTFWTSSQSPFAQRNLVAQCLNIPYNRLRVIVPYVGGGFGSKAGVSMEACAFPLAAKTSPRPVKLRVTREEEFYCTFVRQGLKAKVKIGVDGNGKILAMENTYYWDAGAYTEYGVNITRASGYSSTGPYNVPNVKADSYCCYTNHPVGGPMRGFGMPEIHWAIEQVIDTICRKIQIDPVEFRQLNALKGGDITVTGGVMHNTGLTECIKKAADDLGWDKPKPEASKNRKVGRGIAAMWKAPAMPPNASSGAILKFNEDGTLNLLVSGMEIGQGTYTVMAQMAAEVLGIPYENIKVNSPDTDYSPYEWQTVASRLTWSMGNAVIKAAEDAREQILKLAADHWDCSAEDLDINNSVIYHKSDTQLEMQVKDAVIYGVYGKDGKLRGGPVIGRGNFIPPDVSPLDKETGQGPKSVVHFTTGCQAVEIEVDEETGKIDVKKVSACYDVGRAINPLNVACQTVGGIYMGLSTGLFEQLKLQNGIPVNAHMSDYVTATSMDMPDEIHASYVEYAQDDGPFGARGVGEHTMVPTAPALSNALFDAVGVRIKSMPLTPDKILCAIKEKKMEEAEKEKQH
jgi:CO/xanthine dehydrogenase Mo-binding subunit